MDGFAWFHSLMLCLESAWWFLVLIPSQRSCVSSSAINGRSPEAPDPSLAPRSSLQSPENDWGGQQVGVMGEQQPQTCSPQLWRPLLVFSCGNVTYFPIVSCLGTWSAHLGMLWPAVVAT